MKTIYKLIITAMIAVIANNAFAQTTVKGIVIDSLSKEGVPFATVAVNKPGDMTNFAMTGITDMDGSFSGVIKSKGDYIMTIRSTGKQPIIRKINIKGDKVLDLGKLLMKEAIDTLGTVEVVAQKALVSAEAGKIKYNAEGDPDNKTSTVLDMLRKVPMVTVDGDDNISINGNSSFVVYMNGRKNTMLTDNPSDMLKAMPASSVKNIEVITDPGSKFDAEGAGGIINLITDTQSKTNQIAGNVNLNVTNRQQGAGAGLSVQSGKFAANIRINANHGKSESEMDNLQFQNNGYGAESATRSSNSTHTENDGNRNFGNLGVEASYEIDKSNLIALSGGVTTFGGDSESESTIKSMFNGMEMINKTTSESDNNFKSYNFGVDYQHLFGGNAEKTLTFSYKLWGNSSENNSLSLNLNPQTIDNYNVDYTGRKTDNKTGSAEHTFQIDYSAPVSRTFTVEAGGKYIFRPKKSDGLTFLNNNGTLTPLPDQTVDYTNNDNIGAIYTQVAAKLTDKLSLRGGIRYEYTKQNVEYNNNHARDFSIDYNTVVPSATLNYAISMMQNLSFTYNMRISRPNERQLNPYRDYSSMTSVSFGDPSLEVQKYHNFGISYGLFSMKQNINLSIRYNTCDNGITQWSFYPTAIDLNSLRILVKDEDMDLLHSTYTNATENHTYSGNIYYSIQLGRSARFFTNATLTYSEMKNPISQTSNEGWNGNLFANFQYTFPAKIKTSLGAMMSSKRKTINGTSSGMNMGIFSLEKSFLKDKLTFSFSAMLDLKNGMNMVMESKTNGQGYSTEMKMKNSMGRFGVSISYRFGKQIQVKRAKNSIQNDDFERTEQSGDDTPSMSQGAQGAQGGAMGGAMGGGMGGRR
ncbi:MAG: TonB-dependent receptor [Bacteroidales bacterium]|nr:TonB-dependent receptor [Bacteroidales bacterium]